ncbi:MAG: Lrp/AsnC family transcriptional regulator [Thiohalomonadales bacterium]
MKKLDETDLNILALLYENSRITNKELSAKVNIAPSTCLERVKKLQSTGVIKSFSLEIDHKAIGGNIEAMTAVRLGKHSAQMIESFRHDLVACPEVLSVFYMGGENDFFLHIIVQDSEHLRDFVFRSLTSRDEVVHIETALIYEQLTSHTLPSLE